MTITPAPDAATTGNVGIGTGSAAIQRTLHVRGSEIHSEGSEAGFSFGNRETPDPFGVPFPPDKGERWVWYASGGTARLWSLTDKLAVTPAGNVGIGTVTPAARLSVNGDVEVTGDIQLLGADCAENFDVSEAETAEPGTVMVIDQEGTLKPSEQAYDKRVAGVVSGAGGLKPGIILDKQEPNEGRLPVALMGKVACKVDARYLPIEVGDLLTTSPAAGYAMKAKDSRRAFGAVLGKALRALNDGTDTIPVMVALQ
jgi:hypothetical protein